MNYRFITFPSTVLLLLSVSSCDVYQQPQRGDEAVILTTAVGVSHLYTDRAHTNIEKIDGLSTPMQFASQSLKVSPGWHTLSVSAHTPPSVYSQAMVAMDFKSRQTYTLSARRINAATGVRHTIEIKDTAGRVVLSKNPSDPQYIPSPPPIPPVLLR
jgi:hypothetical protein